MATSGIRTLNPATGKLVQNFPEMSHQEIDERLTAAHEAYHSWRKTSKKERTLLLGRVASLLRKRKGEFARLAALEMGKIYTQGCAEVDNCAAIAEYYAKHGEAFLEDKRLEVSLGCAFITYEPLGVILVIEPWNFPFSQVIRCVVPAIMAGNTVVVKHASIIPQCALALEKLFHDAGAPKGVYTNLFLLGSNASELAADERIRGVSLTGSEKAGASLGSVAGKHIKPAVLELGGSDAFIVMDDADIDLAVKTAALGRIRNTGQVCTSPKRIFISKAHTEAFLHKASELYKNLKVGDPMDNGVDMGPMSSEEALETILEQIGKAVAQGATLVCGGKRLEREGFFMQPTILTDIAPDNYAYANELFGPVLCVYGVDSEEEAVRLSNDSRFGLGGTVFGSDVKKAETLARQVESGMVFINHTAVNNPEMPFGGIKNSGIGRELYILGLHSFVNQKLIRISAPDYPY